MKLFKHTNYISLVYQAKSLSENVFGDTKYSPVSYLDFRRNYVIFYMYGNDKEAIINKLEHIISEAQKLIVELKTDSVEVE